MQVGRAPGAAARLGRPASLSNGVSELSIIGMHCGESVLRQSFSDKAMPIAGDSQLFCSAAPELQLWVLQRSTLTELPRTHSPAYE